MWQDRHVASICYCHGGWCIVKDQWSCFGDHLDRFCMQLAQGKLDVDCFCVGRQHSQVSYRASSDLNHVKCLLVQGLAMLHLLIYQRLSSQTSCGLIICIKMCSNGVSVPFS